MISKDIKVFPWLPLGAGKDVEKYGAECSKLNCDRKFVLTL